MKLKILVILAPGFEEIEAITTIDVLRRADMVVTVAGTVPGPITASRKTRHLPDDELENVWNAVYDMVVLPGGDEGTANLLADPRVKGLLDRQKHGDRWVAAICAAPTILVELGWLDAQKIISHPATQTSVPKENLQAEARVVVDGKLITSLAAGSAMEFAYAIVEQLLGPEAVERVDRGVVAPYALRASEKIFIGAGL